jgi:hypothetical protein
MGSMAPALIGSIADRSLDARGRDSVGAGGYRATERAAWIMSLSRTRGWRRVIVGGRNWGTMYMSRMMLSEEGELRRRETGRDG